MENNLISVEDICSFHNIEINFVRSLEEFGLVQTTIIKKTVFLDLEELAKLERCIRLSKDLEINLEGLHAVAQLLNQLYKMQNEVLQLKNELNYYHQVH
ncbi:chaperone modulator CbpM [Pedobacter paludis]|uniref:MerR family transcriptional regulator n=1 Tax=Pedobacter paludis TaxID=2203212 RepID=A0A317F2W1_9SPHI|nr:chaperone modulator CbpM [Pedobacter paludis]PWS31826.1 MerR family transcriptional regulator [Pedobacter paludis]